MKINFLKIGAVIFFATLALAWGHEETPKGGAPGKTGSVKVLHIEPGIQKSLGIGTEKAKWGTWHDTLDLPGTITPLPGRIHEIHAPVPGWVMGNVSLPRVGERVTKGEVLAVIRQTLTAPETIQTRLQYLDFQEKKVAAQNALAESRTLLALKQKELARAKALYAIKAIALKELQAKEAEYRNAVLAFQAAGRQASLYAHFHLEKGKDFSYQDFPLTSPLSGVVQSADITPGELVEPSQSLFTLVDLSRVWVMVHVYESDLSKIHPGMKADVAPLAYPETQFSGKLAIIGPSLDPKTRTVSAVIELSNRRALLKNGMLVQVSIPVSAQKGILVPSASLVEENGATYVFVKQEEEHFYRRPVILGKRSPDEAIVLQGVKSGEDVVTRGVYILEQQWVNAQNGGSSGGDQD